MGGRLIDLTGKTFTRLTVIERVGMDPVPLWKCVCVCGKIKITRGERLRRGVTRSCGCLAIENCVRQFKNAASNNRKEYGYANSKKIYSQKKRDAKGRGIFFDITFEQFREVSSKNCHYCNVEPLQSNGLGCQCYGLYKYNGMDRVNPSIGYTIINIVPCCWSCNKAKSSLSQKEFYDLITRIYQNRVQKEANNN